MPRSSTFCVRFRLRPAALATRSCVVLCLALCCGIPAHAEKADREKNIEFQGDTGGGNAETKTGELVGHVVISQGTMTIQADRVTFRQNADNSLSATAYGNPVRFREKRDGADDYYEGYAQRIVYDGEKRFVELFDNALLKKTGNEIRSNYISYSAATDNFSAEGRPDAKPAAAGDAPPAPPSGRSPGPPVLAGTPSSVPRSTPGPAATRPARLPLIRHAPQQ